MVSELFVHQLGGTRMIVKVTGDEGDIDIATFPDGLAVVQAFQDGEQSRMLLNEASVGIEILCPSTAS